MRKFPAAAQPALFAILTTGVASFMVSGISTLRAIGAAPGFFGAWIAGWLWSWPIAAATMYVAAPHARRIVERVCAKR
jgi:hypothetical protein